LRNPFRHVIELRSSFALLIIFAIAVALAGCAHSSSYRSSFDVRDFGAAGDGKSLDTASLQRAIEACAASGGRRVVIPRGAYLTGTVRLRSNVTLQIEPGAKIIGTQDLREYKAFTPPADSNLPETPWHRAVILGDGVENVIITGGGTISGGNVTDPQGEENIRGPHAVLFGNAKNVSVRGVTIEDAGNYALLFERCEGIDVHGLKVTGGYDGVHLRGTRDRPCRRVRITDCELYTGDDSVAGWYWDDVVIARCVMNSASNGLRLFGPARNVDMHHCRMFGPGRYEWRTSKLLRHKNMAAGLCIQPSAWGDTPGAVDDVRISSVTMDLVATPLHLANKSPSSIGRVTIDKLTATNVYRAAMSVESWSDTPIERVEIRNSNIEFTGGFGPVLSDPAGAVMAMLSNAASANVQAPGNNFRPLPCWGLYARNVSTLKLQNLRLTVANKDQRPAMIFDGVDKIAMDGRTLESALGRPLILQNR
jgi:polygalacturonase